MTSLVGCECDLASVEEQREFNARLADVGRLMRPPHEVRIETVRRNRIEGGGGLPRPQQVAEGRDRPLAAPHGELMVREFIPSDVRGVYLHCHGGGWVFGSMWEQDVMLWSIARHCRVAVVSVNYRLAPENPFPLPVDDVRATAAWLIDSARAEYATDRLLIGGESAGAHLALCALLSLRDDGVNVRSLFAGAQFSYGIYDLGMTRSQREWGDRFLGLSTPYLAWFYDLLLPDVDVDDRRSAAYSPLYADVAGMPPALFTVGTQDPLLDDSLLMSAHWSDAGNEATLTVYPEAPHGFNVMATAMGRTGATRIREFLSGCLDRRAPDGAPA